MIIRPVQRWVAAVVSAIRGGAALILIGGATPPAAGPDTAVILAGTPAPTLAAYHLFLDAEAQKPAPNLIPYTLNTPLFSDYAVKTRYLYLPPGTRAGYRAEGVLDLPVGAVLIKTFAFSADLRAPDRDVRRIETRLLIHKRSGWTAQTYVWNAAGTQAALKVAGALVAVHVSDTNGQGLDIAYAVPNVNQCKECHGVSGALSPIGPKARNLNGDFAYRSGRENQLGRLARLGLLTGAPAPSAWPRTAVWNDRAQPFDARARAYLDANCGHCHSRAGFASNSGLYLNLEEPQASPAWGIGKRPVAAGRGSGDLAFDIAPGDPEHSILVFRMASTDPGVMMPQIGRSVVDREGLALIRAYVASLKSASP